MLLIISFRFLRKILNKNLYYSNTKYRFTFTHVSLDFFPSYSSIKFVLLSWLDSCRWISASNVQADRPSSCYLGVKSASLVAIYQLPEELATLPRSNGSDSMNSWRISLAFLLSLFLSTRCNPTCGTYWECGTSKWTWGMMHRRAVATFN